MENNTKNIIISRNIYYIIIIYVLFDDYMFVYF
jgi:hypothetical protein